MKVKKRMVWFLTLVCLTAVISVYYLFEKPGEFSFTTLFTDDSLDGAILTGVDETETTQTDSYAFEEFRLEMSNERSQLREQLNVKMASSESTAEEKSAAFDQMNALIEQESNEAMLEMLIKSLGYSDALVRIDEGKVNVTVMSEEWSTQQANEIVYLVRTELDPSIHVSVDTNPNYY
ncbi:MAG: SpoIIIAH-like family protein [Lysinibacillus sp.]